MNSIPDEQNAPARRRDWPGVILVALAFAWLVGVSLLAQFGAWVAPPFLPELAPELNLRRTDVNLIATLAQAAAIALPLLPLALWWRTAAQRAVFRTWLGAALVLAALAPTRLVPAVHPQLALAIQTVLLFLAAYIIRSRWGNDSATLKSIRSPAQSHARWVALTVGILIAYGWLAWGALGSLLDVALGLLLAWAFGAAASWIITAFWLRGFAAGPARRGTVGAGGFVLGGLLIVLASGLGFNGLQPYLVLALPALGWALAALAYLGTIADPTMNRPALALLIAAAAAAPLLGMDPNTTMFEMVLTSGEMPSWAFRATGVAFVLALVSGLVLVILRGAMVRRRAGVLLATALVAALGGAAIYLAVGTPGLYGNRIFVILMPQADVSAAVSAADYDARRTLVYRTLVDHANRSQADLRALLDAVRVRYTPYYLVNAIAVDADEPFTLLLELRGDVDRVLPSPRLRPLPEPLPVSRGGAAAPASPQWNLTLIGADRVWNELGVRGSGIVVGQSDSGVQVDHPELADAYRGRASGGDYNWLDPWFDSIQPTDINGHGTHTLGSVLGEHVGVAPDAQWIGCVNLARNVGNPGVYLDCMQFMLAPYPHNGNPFTGGDPRRSAMVLNNSWGCPDFEGCDPNALVAAVHALRAAGIFTVASAGNDGPVCSSIKDPLALYDDAFSVGAVSASRRVASFSSRGPVAADASGRVKPDLAAPGVDVLSAFPQNTYAEESGTSMAGPHVVGVVALMWSANPKLIGNLDRTEQILRETAAPFVKPAGITCGDPDAKPNDLVGYGIVDAYAAVLRALSER